LPATLSPATGGPDTRAVAELATLTHPLLTGGVMAAWLGPGGAGRSLVALVIELMRRAFGEMRESRGREVTPALVALMLSSQLPGLEGAVRALELPPSVQRQVLTAAATGVYLALRLGVERALREAQAPEELAARIESALGPMAVLGGSKLLLTGGSLLYGCELQAGVPDAEKLVAQYPGGLPVDAVQATLEQTLAGDDAVARRAELAVGLAALRERLVHAVRLGEGGGFKSTLTQYLRELALRPATLTALLADDKARKQLVKDLKAYAETLKGSPAEALVDLANGFKEYTAKAPASVAGLSRAEAHTRYARAATAFVCDLWLERALFSPRRMLYPRTGDEVEGGLEAEYQAGRLYKLSTKQEPLLRSAVSAPVAHLFVDVKDFTRRTQLLGGAAMADFLRREFYVPILSSAKAHYGGMVQLSDKGGVSVNNLLGDALSLSGTVDRLVELARDIRGHLVAYEKRLAQAISPEQVEAALKAIEEEYERKLQTARPGLRPILLREKESALARGRGEGLEAGVFVSYGPAPLIITLDDDVFGRSKVAIADRINESARGTARSGAARAKADARLAQERQRRGNPRLEHPWLVFVGAPLSVQVPYPAEAEARAALKAGDLAGAMKALEQAVRDSLEDAAKHGEDGPGDIYNSGVALSEETLLAYQEAVGDKRLFYSLQVEPETLHPELHERYYFPPEPLRLTVGFHPTGELAEVFRFAGRVMFKGLERKGGLGVWELVDEHGVGQLFARHHASQWLRTQWMAG
jgi:class 3 adenylate cyclase